MAPMYAKNALEEIRARTDIAELIGAYLPLKRAGSAFKALCPFHKEKSPSFHVNPQRQIFKCFGCGEAGDVFAFVMKHEGIDFNGAVQLLARRAGVALETTPAEQTSGLRKDRLYTIHEEAARWFRKVLAEYSGAETARAYLARRRLDGAVADEFQIGYAPEAPDALFRWAREKSFSIEDLEAAGLASRAEDPGPGGRTHYARFRNRVMFPIRDELGRPIAFSGRLLDEHQKAAKYVNSPETLLFKKGRVLFALDKARKAILDERLAILCEGQIDAIRCHTAGIHTAVAPQGTALTEDQAILLRRYADEIVLVFDADTAGQDATLRSIDLLVGAGLTARVATLPVNTDPDAFIQDRGRDAFLQCIAEARPALDFQLDRIKGQFDLSAEAGLLRATRAVVDTIRRAPSEIQREQLIKQAARRLNILEDPIRRELRRTAPKARTAVAAEEPKEEPATRHPSEEMVLAEMLVAFPQVSPLVRHYLPADRIRHSDCRLIITLLMEGGEQERDQLMSRLMDAEESCRQLAAHLLASPPHFAGKEFSPEQVVQEVILKIHRKQLEQQRRELRLRFESAPQEDRQRLIEECHQITWDIHKLSGSWDDARPVLDMMKS
jgi:DNA primase